jgi:hypothetical protein
VRRPPLAALLWLAAIPLALVTTQNLQACAAPSGVVAGLGAALALALAGLHRGWRLAPLALLAACLLPSALLLTTPSVPHAHDLPIHLWGLWGTAKGLAAGAPWPRWHPELGLGQPVLRFYPPMTHWLGAPGLLLGLAPTQVAKALGFGSALAAAAAGWTVLRDRGALPAAAAVGAVAFVLAPYRLLDQNYRFALGELFGLPLALLALHLVHRVATGDGGAAIRRPRRALWLTLTALALTHPLSGLMIAAASAVLLGVTRLHRPLPGLRATGLAAALAFATAGPFLVPAAAEAPEVRIDTQLPSGPRTYSAKALRPGQAFVRERWNGRRLSYTRAQEAERRDQGLSLEEVPFYAGAGLAAAVVLALLGRRRHERALAVAATACWAATLHGPAWAMGHSSLVHPLQFSWRWLGPASLLGALLLGVLFDRWLRACDARTGAALVAAAGALLVLDGAPGYGAGDLIPASPDDALVHFARGEAPPSGCPADARSRRLVAVPHPPPDAPERVAGLLLPPNDFAAPVALVHRAYPEFLSRALARPLVRDATRGDDAALRTLGVRRFFEPLRRDPKTVDPAPLATLEGAPVDRQRPRPGRIDLVVDGPGRLVVREQHLPGWQVRIDGWAPAEAEDGFLAATIPPGRHRVSFRLDPWRPARVGGWVLGLLGLLGGGLWTRRHPAAPRQPAPPA